MHVSIEITTGLERKLTVGVPAEKIENVISERLAEAAKSIRVNGFRPGKVPMREVKRRYGKAIRQDVLGDVMRESFYEAIQGESLFPAGAPELAAVQDHPGEDFEFTATFEVYPEVELKSFNDISVERPVAEITENDVDEMIERLREQRATYNVVEKAAEQGDQLTIDFIGRIDGEAFEGGTSEEFKLVLGSGSMIEGFETGLLGAAAGHERVLELTFPENYQKEELRGKRAQFTVKVTAVAQKTLPEVNEDFMTQFEISEPNLADFRVEIRKNMRRELKNAITKRINQSVFDQLFAMHTVIVPKALRQREVGRQKQQMMQQFGGANQQMDLSWLPDKPFEKRAERAVTLGLILGEVIKSRGIIADKQRMRSYIEELAESYAQPEDLVNHYYQNEQLLSQVEAVVLEQQVVDAILEVAQCSDKVFSYSEAVAPLPAPNEDWDDEVE
jgi:trigger factor